MMDSLTVLKAGVEGCLQLGQQQCILLPARPPSMLPGSSHGGPVPVQPVSMFSF